MTTSLLPRDVLNIGTGSGENHFNEGIGRPGAHTDYSPTQIQNGYTSNPEFMVVIYNGVPYVQFRVRADAAKTSTNTKYPRSELREFGESGTSVIAFSGVSGTHYMLGKSRLMHKMAIKGWICFFQVHDASSDLCRVQLEDTKIVMRNTPPGSDSETVKTVQASYTMTDEIDWKMQIVNGLGTVFLGGVSVGTFPASEGGLYYKAGCYSQSGTASGEAADDYSMVYLRDFQHWHTGWATPDPVAGGGGGSSAPVAGAGADVTVQVNTAFSRTGTETNSPTSRRWSIISGPTGGGTILSTAAAVSWTPVQTGTYVLEYAATNATGTGTDQVTVAVTTTGSSGGGGGGGGTIPGALPSVTGRSTGKNDTASTAHTVAKPAGVVAGEALLVSFASDLATSTPSTSSSGWVMLSSVAQGTTTNNRGTLFYAADAAAASNLVVNLSSAEEATWVILRIADPTTPQFTSMNGSGATLTPAPITPTGGPSDYLAILCLSTDASTTTTQTATFPAGFTNPQSINPGVTSSAASFTADGTFSAVSTITPGTVTLGLTEQHVAHTVVFPRGASTSAPNVNAGPDASVVNGSQFVRSAAESVGAVTVTSRAWTIVSGPTGAGSTIGATGTLSWTPTVNGTYVLRYTLVSSGGTYTDDVTVQVAATSGGGTTGVPPSFVAVGTAASGLTANVSPGVPAGVGNGMFQICAIISAGQEDITTVPSGWLLLDSQTIVSPAGDPGGPAMSWVYYNETGAGAATWVKSGTRFFHAIRAVWKDHSALGSHRARIPGSGTGDLTHELPTVIPANADSRVVSVLMGDLVNSALTPLTPPSGWVERYDATVVSGGENESIGIADFLSSTTVNGTWTSTNPDEASVYAFVLEGPVTGGGTENPVTAPIIDAGPDAAVQLTASPFSRTAGEIDTGSAITARSWTIKSGTAGVGTLLSSGPSVTWTPTVAGTYVLEYSSTNGIGTSKDTVTVTVTTAPVIAPTQRPATRINGFFGLMR